MPDHGGIPRRWPSDRRRRRSRPPDPTSRAWRIRSALARYKGSRLAAIRLAQGLMPSADRLRPAGTAEEITEHLDQPAAVEALAARLPIGARLALSLFAVTEATAMPAAGLAHALGILGADAVASIVRLLELGLLAIEPNAELGPVDDLAEAMDRMGPARIQLRRPSVGPARDPRGAARRAGCRRPRARSARSASRTGWSRSSASAPCGSAPAPSRSGRPSRGRCTSATAIGSRRTRCWPVRSPTPWPPCPTRPPSGWRWRIASGCSSGTRPASGSWPPRPPSGPITRSTCRR